MKIPEALAKIAEGRDYLTTAECAKALNKSPQTLRKASCLFGHAYGVLPIKIGNALMWPVEQIATLLQNPNNPE